MSRGTRACIVLLLVATALAATALHARCGDGVDHAAWSGLLERYVDDDGRVAYRDLAANDAATLDAYLATLAAADPTGWPRDEQLAFWLNAYNAVIFRAVLDGHSAESLLDRYQMFWRYSRTIAGKERTPDDIENRIIRPSGESRIHFALVCASSSCPKLMRRAWTASTLDADLDAQARSFVNDPTRNRIVPGAEDVELSAIFDWYEEDFGGSDEALRAYVARFADDSRRTFLVEQKPDVEFLDYDWSMNAQAGQKPQ
ncbi:MAG: DUF547 domain-containing protein [Deltaproteobacteria bacterium]|nr:DUF547 domain-containing protein [Deltaproteobacteria bacterium]